MNPEEGFALLRDPESWRLSIGRRAVPRRAWVMRTVAIGSAVAVIVAAVGIGWAVRDARGHALPPAAISTPGQSPLPPQPLTSAQVQMATRLAIARAVASAPTGHTKPARTDAWPDYVTSATAIVTDRASAGFIGEDAPDARTREIVIRLVGRFTWPPVPGMTTGDSGTLIEIEASLDGVDEGAVLGPDSQEHPLPSNATVLYPTVATTSVCSVGPSSPAALSDATITLVKGYGVTLSAVKELPVGAPRPDGLAHPDEAGAALAADDSGSTDLGTVNGSTTWDHRKVFVYVYDGQVQPGAPGEPVTCGNSLVILDATTGEYVIQAQY